MFIARPQDGFKIIRSGIAEYKERGIALSDTRQSEYEMILDELRMDGHKLGEPRFDSNQSMRKVSITTDAYDWYIEFAVLGDTLEILFVSYDEK